MLDARYGLMDKQTSRLSLVARCSPVESSKAGGVLIDPSTSVGMTRSFLGLTESAGVLTLWLMLKVERRILWVISAAILCLAGGCCCPAGRDADNKQGRLLRHVVLIEFKETVTAEQIKETEKLFCEMAGGIKEIKDFEWGTDVSGGQRTAGFTHCFILTFVSEAGRDRYKTNPAHNELRAATQPYIKKMLVLDYWKN